jgi:hypothetical protein
MFFLARGRNPWDMVRGRLWSTRIRTGRGVAGEDTALQNSKTQFLSTATKVNLVLSISLL